MAEPDGVETLVAAFQRQLQVFFADQALVAHHEFVQEQGGGETRAPDLLLQHAGHVGVGVARFQRSVGLDDRLESVAARQFAHGGVEGGGEGGEILAAERQAGRHGVAAELAYQVGVALGHQVQRVAQVHVRDGAAGAADFVVAGGREGQRGPPEFFLQARGHQPHDALVPAGIEHADGGAGGRVRLFHGGQRLFAHLGLDRAALAVDVVEFARHFQRLGLVVGGQAGDAQAHVGQPARGVDARAQREAQVETIGAARFAARDGEQGAQPGLQAARAHALQALGDQQAVVRVQLDHVGHRAQRHQVRQRVQARAAVGRVHAAPAQFGAQCQHHVENDAHARQVLGRKAAAGLVGVHDGQRGRQGVAGQVVVGDHHADARGVGRGHAVHAGDAVVHRDDDVGLAGAVPAGQFHDGGRQAVAGLETVGNQEVHVGAHRGQGPQPDRAGGGAVAVVVGHDQQLSARLDGVGQHAGGMRRMRQAGGRQQGWPGQPGLVRMGDAAGGPQAGQQGMDARGFQDAAGVQVGRADSQAG
ncbi:hypothetical protein D9M72_271580 [compost metagenome]